MAISLKGKRKIIVDKSVYYWWVLPEIESGKMLAVYVLAADRKLFIKYFAVSANGDYTVCIKKTVNGRQLCSELSSPKFLSQAGVSPKMISFLVNWCETV